jgi:hypothetical protein
LESTIATATVTNFLPSQVSQDCFLCAVRLLQRIGQDDQAVRVQGAIVPSLVVGGLCQGEDGVGNPLNRPHHWPHVRVVEREYSVSRIDAAAENLIGHRLPRVAHDVAQQGGLSFPRGIP